VVDIHPQGSAYLGSAPSRFTSTAWSMVLGAQESDPASSRRCIELLMHRYWRPVFAYVRRLIPNADDAGDVTQGFFAAFLERGAVKYADRARGRFRSFLIASVRRYMQYQHRKDIARPEHMPILDMDALVATQAFFDGASEDPARLFMKNWAKCVVEAAVARLEQECLALGKKVHYDTFALRFLTGGEPTPYERIASELDISLKNVSNYFERAKKRFARILRDEVSNSMCPDEDVDLEIRDLLAALAS
jgi:RNA polymerase sigma-70 factor (ECF subfamily)